MRLTAITYFGKREGRTLWMARRVSRPIWQTANKVTQPGQQEEPV